MVSYKTGHAWRVIALNEIQTSGSGIACPNSATPKFIQYCVVCRRLTGKLVGQKMVELPFDRLQEKTPFTSCGPVLFRPYVIWSKRKELKRYGVIFVCLCRCAIHLEVAHSSDTDSFLLILRRFIGRRGKIWQMRSDKGSNLFRTGKEMRKSFQVMNHSRIDEYFVGAVKKDENPSKRWTTVE